MELFTKAACLAICLFLLNAACTPGGPKITGCVVDSLSNGFQCVTYPKKKFFNPISAGSSLLCQSPQDLELELKACKYKRPVPLVTLCIYQMNGYFQCTDPKGVQTQISVFQADNYFCTSIQDRTRLLERCSERI